MYKNSGPSITSLVESFSFRSVFYVVVSVICDSFNILCWCYYTSSRIIKIKYGFDRDDCVDFTSCGGGSPDRTVFSFRGTSEIAMAYDFVAGEFI